MPDNAPWWAVATSIPPPNVDPDQWEAMGPRLRMAAWTEYRNNPNNAQEANEHEDH